MANFNYLLNKQDYSLKNALLWGNCIGHCKKATKGSLGNRSVHALISLVEAIPVIGQVASLFEMLIVIKLSPPQGDISKRRITVPNNDNPSSSQDQSPEILEQKPVSTPKVEPAEVPEGKVASVQDKKFEDFKSRIIADLPEHIKNEQTLPKNYSRSKLSALITGINSPISVTKAPEDKMRFSPCTAYGYNAEGINDLGWGCAWRAIQTCLSSYNIFVPFEDLFHLFGRLENLQAIYKHKYGKELPTEKHFAPYDLSSGWAEPFICDMVMHFYNIEASLESVNGIPGNCNAPPEVFPASSLSFSGTKETKGFRTKLIDHFNSDNPAPVMIDDGSYALNIIGIKEAGPNVVLWIADTHIKAGVNPTSTKPIGLYTITLDQTGDRINSSLYKDDRDQLNKLYSNGGHIGDKDHPDRGLTFRNKRWMVLFPQKLMSTT